MFIQPAGQMTVLSGKNLNIGHCTQTFQSNFVCHFSVTLTLARVTRSVQCKTFKFHFLAHFLSAQNKILSCVEAVQVKHPCTTF